MIVPPARQPTDPLNGSVGQVGGPTGGPVNWPAVAGTAVLVRLSLVIAGGGTRVSAEAGQFSRWGRGPVLPVGVRLTRRVREEPPPGELARVYFDRSATMSGAQRRGSGGMDRRPNAAWVSLPAVWPGWIAGRTPRGFHCRLFGRDGSPAVSGAGRKHRVDPGAEGTGGGTTRPPSLLGSGTPPGFHHRLLAPPPSSGALPRRGCSTTRRAGLLPAPRRRQRRGTILEGYDPPRLSVGFRPAGAADPGGIDARRRSEDGRY